MEICTQLEKDKIKVYSVYLQEIIEVGLPVNKNFSFQLGFRFATQFCLEINNKHLVLKCRR